MENAYDADDTPLLPEGFHPMSLRQLRELCVVPFPNSTTRAMIMEGLESVCRRITGYRIPGELWVNGSYVTVKADPRDVDVLLRVPGMFYDTCLSNQREAIRWATAPSLKTTYRVDAYLWAEYRAGDPRFPVSEDDREYWMRQFGQSRRGHRRGMAVLRLTEKLYE
jgi:hypothetical protein